LYTLEKHIKYAKFVISSVYSFSHSFSYRTVFRRCSVLADVIKRLLQAVDTTNGKFKEIHSEFVLTIEDVCYAIPS